MPNAAQPDASVFLSPHWAPVAAPFPVQDSNPLNVLPVAPRFQYLPISAPQPAATQPGGVAGPGAGPGAVTVSGSSVSLVVSRLRPSTAALNRHRAPGECETALTVVRYELSAWWV